MQTRRGFLRRMLGAAVAAASGGVGAASYAPRSTSARSPDTLIVGRGLREDVADLIYDISPTETPFGKFAQREVAKWVTDFGTLAYEKHPLAKAVAEQPVREVTIYSGEYGDVGRSHLSCSDEGAAIRQMAKRASALQADMDRMRGKDAL